MRGLNVGWFFRNPLTRLVANTVLGVLFVVAVVPLALAILAPIAATAAWAVYAWLGVGPAVIAFALAVVALRWSQAPKPTKTIDIDMGKVSASHPERVVSRGIDTEPTL